MVGAGSAGAVVAARLSEDPSVSVLLVEAGGDGNLVSNVPALQGMNMNGEIDWSYRTKPDGRTCLGIVNGSCAYHRGKALGGTSNINSLIYIRGALKQTP